MDVQFQMAEITQKGVEKRPLLHLAFAKSPRVKTSLKTGIKASMLVSLVTLSLIIRSATYRQQWWGHQRKRPN